MLHSLQLHSLEARLTPAGGYTSAVVGGILTLTGTDDAENITILDNGVGVLVTGNGGTLVDGVNVVAFGMPINGIKIIGKGGDDVVSLDGTNPINWSGGLDIDLGDSSTIGGNVFNLTAANTITLANIKLKGGDGLDTANFGGTAATIAKDFAADFGNGGSFLAIQTGTTISGNVAVKALVGYDEVYLEGVAVTKNVNLTSGDGGSYLEISQGSIIDGNVGLVGGFGSDDVGLDNATIKGKKGLTLTGNSGNVSVSTLGNPSALTVGGITATSKDGFVNFAVGTGANLTVPGAITLTGTGVNANINADLTAKALTFSALTDVICAINTGVTSVTIGKDVKLTSKQGGANLQVGDGALTIGGLLTVAANTNVNVGLQTTGTVSVTGNVSISAKLLQANLIQSNGTLLVNGNLLVSGGLDAQANLDPVGTSNIAGLTTITGKAGIASLTHFGAGDITFGKALTVAGKNFTLGQFFSTGITNINGAMKLSAAPTFGFANLFMFGDTLNFADGLSVTASNVIGFISPVTVGTITKDVVITGGANGLVWNSNQNISYGGNVTLTTGNEDAFVNITGSNIANNLTITTGNGDDNLTLDGVTVGGTTTIKTNGGGDLLTVNNEAVFTGITSIDTGTGDDTLFLGQGIGLGSNAVTFTGKATITTGLGNDTLLLGVSASAGGDAFSLVSFGAGSVVDGGANLNLFDDEDSLTAGGPLLPGWTDPTP